MMDTMQGNVPLQLRCDFTQSSMIRVKHPIEYELTPDAVERGSHWLTVRIKNTGDNDLQNLNVKMHSLDSIHISFRNPNHYKIV